MSPKTGRTTATTTLTSPDTDEVNLDIGLVNITVKSTEAAGVIVCSYNDTDGVDVEPGTNRWFPVQNLKFMRVKAASGSVEYTWYAK